MPSALKGRSADALETVARPSVQVRQRPGPKRIKASSVVCAMKKTVTILVDLNCGSYMKREKTIRLLLLLSATHDQRTPFPHILLLVSVLLLPLIAML